MIQPNYTYKIKKIVKVVDGDTVDALIDLGFHTYVHKRIRLYGLNTPECRTRDKEEKKRGLAAKKRVKELLKSKELYVLSHGVGKFGRVLGELFDGESNINDTLVNEGHAVKYFGGKRN
jgi:micrococcal nuclease